jgi:hypothetical protein
MNLNTNIFEQHTYSSGDSSPSKSDATFFSRRGERDEVLEATTNLQIDLSKLITEGF